MVEDKPRELQGWKQIAAYLGVSIPTAKRYYEEFGLPAFKRGGRYFATPEAVDEWLASPAAKSAKRGEEPAEPPTAPAETTEVGRLWPPLVIGAAAAALALAVAALALAVGLWRDEGIEPQEPDEPSQVQAIFIDHDARTFRTVDLQGRTLVTFTLPDFSWKVYEEKEGLNKFIHADVDQDGRGEAIYFNCPERLGTRTCRIECLNEDRTLLWQFAFGKKLTFKEGRRIPIDRMYVAKWMWWVRTPESVFVLAMARHHRWFPTQVVLLEPSSGRLVSQYWHPGYIYSVAFFDTDGDGENELLLGGTNNPFEGFGHPSLAILDLPFGQSRDVPGNPFGRANAKELRYFLFPFLDVFRSRRDGGGKVAELVVKGPNLLEAQVGRGYERWLYYQLDAKLKVIDAHPSDPLTIDHNRAFREGLLDHPYDERERVGWMSRVLEFPTAPNANSDEVRRRFAELEKP